MIKTLFRLAAAVSLSLMVTACAGADTDPILFSTQTFNGVGADVEPSTGATKFGAMNTTNNNAYVPQTVQTENGRVQLQSTYFEYYENGRMSMKVTDGPSTCAVFEGFANISRGQGNIGVDQGFATGVAAQDLCLATRSAPVEIIVDAPDPDDLE